MHHIGIDRLRKAYLALNRKAARGVHGLSWKAYGEGLETRLVDLHARLHSGRYRPQPVQRVWIPKADGRKLIPGLLGTHAFSTRCKFSSGH